MRDDNVSCNLNRCGGNSRIKRGDEMSKYHSATDSFRPGQLDWLVDKIKDHTSESSRKVPLVVSGILPTIEEAGVLAIKLSETLSAQEQAFFVAGFQECLKYLTFNYKSIRTGV